MATFQLESAIALMHQGLTFPPAIVGWNRLEGRPRTVQFDRALRAEVRDALWLLTRQWQFGEFNGEDAGSPVEVRTAVRVDSLQHYAVTPDQAVAYDGSVPLETHVEREPIRFDLVIHSQVTRYFWRLIGPTLVTRPAVRAAYLAGYPLRAVSGVDDDDARHVLQIGGAHLLDASDLLSEIASGAHDTRVNGLAGSVGLAAADIAQLQQAGLKLRAWFLAQFSQPLEDGDDAWRPQSLEYRFAVATETAERGQSVLVANHYTQGHLDWYAFDVDATPGARLTRRDASAAVVTPSSVTPVSFIPTPVSFGGMPRPRYWEMESRQIEFADIDANTTDVAKLLLTEFALIYGNDWCVIPYEVPVGSLCEVVGMLVMDDFQEQSLLLPAGRGRDDGWQRWSMFTMSRSPPVGEADLRLLVPPALPKLMEAPSLEKVYFLRDEMANMAWGVERTVPSRLGFGIDAARLASRSAGLAPAAAAPLPTTAPVRYLLGTDVPANWFPFIPVHVPGSNRSVQLQRARMPSEGGVARTRNGVILDVAAPYYINEEEVPRAGKLVTRGYQRGRWIDGTTYTWVGRRVLAGRGEGASGLAFDQLRDVPNADV